MYSWICLAAGGGLGFLRFIFFPYAHLCPWLFSGVKSKAGISTAPTMPCSFFLYLVKQYFSCCSDSNHPSCDWDELVRQIQADWEAHRRSGSALPESHRLGTLCPITDLYITPAGGEKTRVTSQLPLLIFLHDSFFLWSWQNWFLSPTHSSCLGCS